MYYYMLSWLSLHCCSCDSLLLSPLLIRANPKRVLCVLLLVVVVETLKNYVCLTCCPEMIDVVPQALWGSAGLGAWWKAQPVVPLLTSTSWTPGLYTCPGGVHPWTGLSFGSKTR
jgi:hypothetical protein